MENNRLERCLLLDFYGELLTDKQRECCDLHYNEDLSLGEIAEQLGISRQGVWDNIKRAEQSLEETEAKTGLIRRFSKNREKLEALYDELVKLRNMTDGEAKKIAEKCVADVESMKLDAET